MKTYTPDELNVSMEFVREQVKRQISDSPEMSNQPAERAAAILEPLEWAVKLAGCMDGPTLQALVMRKFGGASDADRDRIRDFLDKLTGAYEQVKAPA